MACQRDPRPSARHLGEHASLHGSTSTLFTRNLTQVEPPDPSPSASPLPPTPPLLTLRPHCRCIRRHCKRHRLRRRRHRLRRRYCRRAEHRTAAANWHQPSSLSLVATAGNTQQPATGYSRGKTRGRLAKNNFRLTSINPQYGITTSDQAIHTVAGA